MLKKLRLLEEEEPELHVGWNEKTKDILIKVMGEVQIEVLKTRIEERFGVSVDFGTGHIVHRETIADTRRGADESGHRLITRRCICAWSREKRAAVFRFLRNAVKICWQRTGSG